jgi:hypothetical protein
LEISVLNTSENGVIMADGLDNSCLLLITADSREWGTDIKSTHHMRKSGELADLKDRYAEVLNLLHDTQEQLCRQRRKGMPQARGGLFSSLGCATNLDSIASELENSLYSELRLDSGIGADHRYRE